MVNVTIGIVFCVDSHNSNTWLSTVCPANTCNDFMRLYEYAGRSESSLDLVGFAVHRLIYSCGARCLSAVCGTQVLPRVDNA